MKQQINNKTLIILLVIFGFMAFGFGGYFVYDKFIANTEEIKNNDNSSQNNNSDSRPGVTKIDLITDCLDESNKLKKTCDKYLTLNGENIDITIIGKNPFEEDDYLAYVELRVNNKKVFETEQPMDGNNPPDAIIKGMEVLEDLIMIHLACIDGNSNSSLIIDKNGNKLKTIKYSDTENFCLASSKIVGNKIIITETEAACSSGFDCNDFCMSESEYNQKADNIVGVEKEISYLGNNKFSEIRKVRDILFKDINTRESLDSSCCLE